MAQRIALGAMTGTSIDGIDLALARIEGEGLAMRATLVAHRSAPLGALAPRLRAVAQQQPVTAQEFAQLALDLGELHAREALALLREARVDAPPALAALHGQTLFHRPPASLQLINPHPVALALRCPVVTDLRGEDLARGGQGAPLTPLADWVLLRAPHARAVVNLGGFANATLLPADDASPPPAQVARIRGRDLCACNQLLDRAARAAIGADFDADGATAARGRADAPALAALRALLAPPEDGRSLGTGDELFAWIDAHARTLAPADLLATAAAAVGATIGEALRPAGCAQILLAGGGARHRPLAQAIAHAAGVPAAGTDTLGIPVDAREALEWAVLGALAADGVDPALPAVTRRPAGAGDAAASAESRRHGCWTHTSR
ncbi:MAG: anhydro-N-acetylmuramic acid kinase [Phycisphaerales bacterium]